MIEISQDELSLFLICLLRYALGRRSYVVTDATLKIEKYFHKLTVWERDRVIQEIQEALDAANRGNRHVGDKIDHDAWEACVERLKVFRTIQKTLEE